MHRHGIVNMVHRSEAVRLFTVLLLGVLLLLSVALLHTRRNAEVFETLRRSPRCRAQKAQRIAPAAYASDDGLQRPQCTLIVPADHQSEGSGNITFNPAGVFDPEVGWLVIARHEPEVFHVTYPLVWLLGRDPASVNLSLVNATEAVWELDSNTLGAGLAAKRGHRFVKTEDFRPFLWNGSLYTSLSMWSGDWQREPVVVCMYRMDVAQQTITAARCFDKLPLQKNGHIREKNWGFKEFDGDLLILHRLAPTMVVLRVAPGAPKGLELVAAMSFNTDTLRLQILSHTGLSFDGEVHISGHPVDFPTSLMGRPAAGKGRREWFVMAHRRSGHVYQHWGFRISLERFELTHVSRGPILSPFTMAGETNDTLIVGSYHFTKHNGTDSLTMFFGLGDDKSCVTHVEVDSIAWHRLPPGRRLDLKQSGYQVS